MTERLRFDVFTSEIAAITIALFASAGPARWMIVSRFAQSLFEVVAANHAYLRGRSNRDMPIGTRVLADKQFMMTVCRMRIPN